MNFGRIQKLTLLDYPDKTACTLFTVGCNFKCPFCQNSSLINPENETQTQSTAEVLKFLKTRKGLLDGVCISGGEPLLNDDLGEFISDVKKMGFSVKLDTNGSYPEKLKKLIESEMIDYIAMDIKNSPEKYVKTIGLSAYDIFRIEESICLLQSSGISHEFRTTAVKEFHSPDDILSIARWLSNAERYYLQGFIDSEGVLYSGFTAYSEEEMQELIQKVKEVLPVAELRGI